MDGFNGHQPGLFESLLNDAKDSRLNSTVQSLAASLGLHADWLVGDQTGSSHSHSASHVDAGLLGTPSIIPPDDGSTNGASEHSILGTNQVTYDDRALIDNIQSDTDYLSPGGDD